MARRPGRASFAETRPRLRALDFVVHLGLALGYEPILMRVAGSGFDRWRCA